MSVFPVCPWIAADLRSLAVPVADLAFLPGNPRRGSVDAVAQSYAIFGQRKPIVVCRAPDGSAFVEAGNHQLAACGVLAGIAADLMSAVRDSDETAAARIEAEFRGAYGKAAQDRMSDLVDLALAADGEVPFSRIAVTWVDEDVVSAKAFALADNRTSELGDYDPALLLALFHEVQADNASLLAGADYDFDRFYPDVLPPEVTTEPAAISGMRTCPKCGYSWPIEKDPAI